MIRYITHTHIYICISMNICVIVTNPYLHIIPLPGLSFNASALIGVLVWYVTEYYGGRNGHMLVLWSFVVGAAKRVLKSTWIFQNDFYPRPVLAFGYCRCLRLCVCVSVCLCVCQSRVCPRDNSSPVQARITKFGAQMQNTLVKVPIVLWVIDLDLQGQI